METWDDFLITDTLKVALNEGSSKQGNARRAYVGAMLVAATYLQNAKKGK
jgi:hypothetical protein